MNRVYLYRDQVDLVIEAEEVQVSYFKGRWFLYSFLSSSFRLVSSMQPAVFFELPCQGDYALHKKEVIPIKSSHKRVLLVSDIDGTLFYKSDEACLAYSNFSKFWIQNFLLNDSYLVYNTGRSIQDYSELKETLLAPDLLITTNGNIIYGFNEFGEELLQSDYSEILPEYFDLNWSSSDLHECLIQRFEILQKCPTKLTPHKILYKISDKDLPIYIEEIKQFVLNENNEFRKEKQIKGKAFALKCGMIRKHFIEIIPRHSGKHLGIIYPQRKYGFENKDTLFAGDSPNDIDAFKCPVHGVLVGNSEELLIKWFQKKPRPLKYYSSLNYANAIVEALTRLISD